MDSVTELRYLILGAQREGSRELNELLGPLGLTPAQAEVLTVLREAGGSLTLRQLGRRLVCETGSPSRLVSVMVDAELVSRTPRADDKRAADLMLTARGHEAAERVVDAERSLHGWLASSLSSRDITGLVRGLRKLVAGRPAGEAIALRRAS